MDFLEQLKAHMEGQGYTPSIVEIGTYREDGEAVALRPTPANISVRDMAKGKEYPFGVQVLIHDRSNYRAYTTAQKIMRDYDGLDTLPSGNNSYTLQSLFVTVAPNHVQETSHGTLYTMMLEANLYIGG